MPKTAIIVLDTETCNITASDKVLPRNNLTYDIGFEVIYPSTGESVCTRSYIVREIFFGEWKRMQTSYYANKLPQYYADIADGLRQVQSFFDIMNEIKVLCQAYHVTAICAHNARFDVDALNTTADFLTGRSGIHALPNVEIWDSMKMAKTFTNTPTYRRFCEENEYMTKHATPRPRMTAEIIYRFIIQDLTFEESHTALEDVKIEKEIVLKAYRTHKKMDRVLYHRE